MQNSRQQKRNQTYLDGPRHTVQKGSDAYPPMLLDLQKPPECLYVTGNPEALCEEYVSIIGARKSTPYGIACARLAARVASEMHIGVVSGAAIGCDSAAQEEALRSSGRVCAVMGCGADVIYPASSADLLRHIVETGGAVVSLRPWGTPPAKWTFVERNAIIAALSRVLIVCEAGIPSGTFLTAETASQLNRTLFVFPGSVFSPNSAGCNYLIASDPRAIPVWDRMCLQESFSLVYARLAPSCCGQGHAQTEASQYQCASESEQDILTALSADPQDAETLAANLNLGLVECVRLLGGLEMRGMVERLRDGRFSPAASILLQSMR